MTTVELMDNLAIFLQAAVADYSTRQPSGKRAVKVYAGYPPARMSADEQASFVYALVTGAQDTADGDMFEYHQKLHHSQTSNSEIVHE